MTKIEFVSTLIRYLWLQIFLACMNFKIFGLTRIWTMPLH